MYISFEQNASVRVDLNHKDHSFHKISLNTVHVIRKALCIIMIACFQIYIMALSSIYDTNIWRIHLSLSKIKLKYASPHLNNILLYSCLRQNWLHKCSILSYELTLWNEVISKALLRCVFYLCLELIFIELFSLS